MSSVFNCLILLCVVSLVTAQQANYSTTIRPPPHHRHMHHGNHKHNRTHITNEDTNPILHLLPLDTSGGMRTTTKPSAASSIRSQKLFLINANQQPTSSSASATNDLYQPNFSPRWPSTLHSHYPIHNTGHHRPRTTTMDLGYDWRSRGTRTFYADAPYTTITPPTTSYRPEHRFSGKHGRHVCADLRTLLQPVTHTNEPCRDSKLCKDIRSQYHNHQRSIQTAYNCCPGWARVNKNSAGCNKPICKLSCKHGGKCIKPNTCKCPIGFDGPQCETDINECVTEKPCDQLCFNTNGSYYCMCRDGFALQEDKQSCKKIAPHENDVGPAFEARDLENDVDIDDLGTKISDIQKSLDVEKQSNADISKRIISTVDVMNNLKMRMDGVENRQLEINFIRDRLKSYEMQFNKLQYSVDYLYKCRMHPSIYCP